MNTSVSRLLFAAFGLVSVLAVSAHANTTLLSSSAWDSQADGSALVSPWSQQYGGGSTPAASTVTVTTYQSQKWAFLNNAATNESASNPSLQGNFSSFSSTTDTLAVVFDYIIPANYGAGSQIQFNLNQYVAGTTTAGIVIGLGRNYQINGLYYIDSSGIKQSVGHTFTAGERVTVSLTNISLATKTYDFSWSSSEGGSSSVSNIAMRNAGSISSLSYLTIGDNSAVGGTSEIYIRDFSVTSVSSPIPEPSTVGLLIGLAVLGGAITRRRR